MKRFRFKLLSLALLTTVFSLSACTLPKYLSFLSFIPGLEAPTEQEETPHLDNHEDNSSSSNPKEIYFKSEGDYIYYSDDYFRHKASRFDEHLATLSVLMAKYSQNKDGPNNIDDENWYHNQSGRLKEFYHLIGFEHTYFNEDYYSRTSFDTIGIGCASRLVTEGNNKFTVIACTVRSGGYFLEWENNVYLGDGSRSDMMHEGWYNAANRVINFVGEYLKMLKRFHYIGTEQIKLWMSGFSRGGAVMNLAGGLIDNKLGEDDSKTRYTIYDGFNLKREDVLVYTFETPQGANVNSTSVKFPKDAIYNNIFNIINPNDIVPKVAMSHFGFTRFGIDKFITTKFFAPDAFETNRRTTKLLYADKDPGYNWKSDNFKMSGISFKDLLINLAEYTGLAGIIYKWVTQGDLKPDIISDDTKKVNYDANIATTIVMDHVFSSLLTSRQLYVNNFQNFAKNLMHYIFNDCPDEDILSWKALLWMAAIQGVGYNFFPGGDFFIDYFVNFSTITGCTSTEVKYALLIAYDLFMEYPSELISLIDNIDNVYENHSTELCVMHAKAQDSYYINAYNEKHSSKIKKVPYRNNSAMIRFECLDINQGELHKDGNIVVQMTGGDTGASTIDKCNEGFAVGYYNYASYERTEWFAPACYTIAYGFYEHSLDIEHRVYIYRHTYGCNKGYYEEKVKIVDEYYSGDAEVFTGHVDPDCEPEDEFIKDLSGTTWEFGFPEDPLPTKYINFESNDTTFGSITFDKKMGYDEYMYLLYYNDVYVTGRLEYDSRYIWEDQDYKIIKIIDGQDATNAELINWLYKSAIQIV